VTDSTNATLVKGTLNSCEIGTMISRNMVKSKASSVQPSQAAHHAIHWSLVGSLHHGISFAAAGATAMATTSFALAESVSVTAVCVLGKSNADHRHPQRSNQSYQLGS
jgi:hypothetical protein